jgi:hypothetical protein
MKKMVMDGDSWEFPAGNPSELDELRITWMNHGVP